MMRARLKETMARLGLETVGAIGELFDPTRHEAILYESDPEATDQTVSLVIRPGYRVDGRLLRPAEVVVRGPRPTPTTAAETDIDERPDDRRQRAPATPGRPDLDQRDGG